MIIISKDTKLRKGVADLSGQTIGNFYVIRFDGDKYEAQKSKNKSKRCYWVCRCLCGKLTSVETSALKSSRTKSCGLCYTFKDWCTDNDRKNYLDLWDYKLNKVSPDMVTYKSSKKYWFKCPKHNHDSELKRISTYTIDTSEIVCNKCNSFGQYLIDSGISIDDTWSDKNKMSPFEVSNSSARKVLLKCSNTDYHDDYAISCDKFKRGTRCPYCNSNSGKVHVNDSFAGYHIKNTDCDFLNRYWDYEKNKINPYNMTKSNNRYIWIKCQDNEYHGSYKITCSDFTHGYRCSYCGNKKVHILDSVGFKHQKCMDAWSSKNKSSPYSYKPYSDKVMWFKCIDGIHGDFKRSIGKSTRFDFRCPVCATCSVGELKIHEMLEDNDIDFEYQKTFEGLYGVGEGLLSYDFYIPSTNTLIEFQGVQHYMPVDYFGGEEKFAVQQEHDKRKRLYAIHNDIKLVQIKYNDIENIDKILSEVVK